MLNDQIESSGLDYEVLDGVVSLGMQDYIERTVSEENFPWYYTEGISLRNTNDNNTGFSHTIFRDSNDEERYKGSYTDMLLPVLYDALGDIKLKRLLRIRAAMFLRGQNNGPHMPHIDQPEYPKHKTMIYYVNAADGPTNLWEGDKITEEIEFKRGRILIIDGKVRHSSSCPVNSPRRMVINYNFLI